MYRAADENRDQSYFLFNTTREQLDYLRFPLGGLLKSETRDIAKKLDLNVADKPDSQDICFVPNGDYTSVIKKYRPQSFKKGDILNLQGEKLGSHDGIINYTIGQRKGIKISSKEPLYVIDIKAKDNSIIVGSQDYLNIKKLYLRDINLLSDLKIFKNDICIKVRSTGKLLKAKVIVKEGLGTVEILQDEKGISPGQACVFYSEDDLGERVLGGGWIDKTLNKNFNEQHEILNKSLSLMYAFKDEFESLAHDCHKNHFQLCTHAIGDKGNQFVLDTYNNVLKDTISRWRIEHAQMVHPNDIDKFLPHRIIPSMQPSHCTSDMPWLEDRLGSHRIDRISKWRTFIDKGLKIAGGSDCPIETGNPLFEFYAACTRQNHNGYPKGGWQPQEKVNSMEALKMLTTWGAHAEFNEYRRGKISIGFDADFTILSDDITTCSPQTILKTEVIMTIVGGKIVYKR